MLNKESILAANDLTTETVNVPEWQGEIKIRSWTGAEREQFEKSVNVIDGKVKSSDVLSRIAVLSICDDDGKRIFTDADIPALSKKSAAALERIADKAVKLNGLTESDIEELAKN